MTNTIKTIAVALLTAYVLQQYHVTMSWDVSVATAIIISLVATT